MTRRDDLLGDGMAEPAMQRLGTTLDCRDGVHGGCEICDCPCHGVTLLADLAPTDGVDRTFPLPDCTVGAELVLMTDGRRLFVHVCDRRPTNLNRSARFRSNAGVIRAAPELDPQHAIASLDPLTLTPSILCLDCGLHGFIRAGHWISA